jgi:hypothetical protein
LKRKLKFIGMTSALALVAVLAGCSKKPSKEQLETGGELCRAFIAKEMKTGRYDLDTTITDAWMKEGKVVFEVGYREKFSEGSSYSIRLCIYDEAQGTLSSPSPFNSSKWDK